MQHDTAKMLQDIRIQAQTECRESWAYAFGRVSEMIGITLDKFPDAKAFFVEQFSVKPETQTETK